MILTTTTTTTVASTNGVCVRVGPCRDRAVRYRVVCAAVPLTTARWPAAGRRERVRRPTSRRRPGARQMWWRGGERACWRGTLLRRPAGRRRPMVGLLCRALHRGQCRGGFGFCTVRRQCNGGEGRVWLGRAAVGVARRVLCCGRHTCRTHLVYGITHAHTHRKVRKTELQQGSRIVARKAPNGGCISPGRFTC